LYMAWGLTIGDSRDAMRCAVQWFLYSITLAVKMSLMVFTVGSNITGIQEVDPSLLSLGTLLTPLIYVAFYIRAKAGLFSSPTHFVSAETLLHADIGIITTMDYIDIMVTYVSSREIYLRQQAQSVDITLEWLCFSMIIATLISVVVLGCAFPSCRKQDKAVSRPGDLDVFFSSKQSYLMGIFFIDLPFAACRLAERESVKGIQAAFFHSEEAPSQRLINKTGNNSHGIKSIFHSETVFGRSQFDELKPEAQALVNMQSKAAKFNLSKSFDATQLVHPGDKEQVSVASSKALNFQATGASSSGESTFLEECNNSNQLDLVPAEKSAKLLLRSAKAVLSDLKHLRHLPTKGFSTFKVFKMLFVSLWKNARFSNRYRGFLDSNLTLRYWQQLLVPSPMQ
ncbi:hypothetical protein IE077_003916, partial [Cardiosporidium cionae]